MEDLENKMLFESDFDLGMLDPETQRKMKKRALDAVRVAKLADAAAKKAEADGFPKKAEKLRQAAVELQELSSKLEFSDDFGEEGEGESSEKGEGQAKDSKNQSANKNDEQAEGEGEGKESEQGQKDSQNQDKKGQGKNKNDKGDGLDDTDIPVEGASDQQGPSKNSQNDGKSQGSSQGQQDSGSENGDDGEGADSKDSGDGESEDEGSEGEESEGEESEDGEGSGNNSEEEEGEESKENEDDPIKDIFNDNMTGKMSQSKQGGKEPRDPTVDEIIKQLKNLPAEARRGAIAGLNDLLSGNGRVDFEESLTEATKKTIVDMTDDEFANTINKVLDLINETDKVTYSDDIEARKNKIQKLANDTAASRALEVEDNVELRKDYQKVKAREKENTKYTNYRTLDDFKINFYRAIKNQVEKVEAEEETYNRINGQYEDDDLIVPGERVDELPGDVPSIDMYIDQSASWTDEDVEKGKQAIASVQQFADRGEIKLNIYYFAVGVYPDARIARAEGSTTAWNKILQNIKTNKTKNVVLMTDCDMDTQAERGPVCKVPGEVWFIWKLDSYWNKTGSKSIPEHLIGKMGNHQYAFKAGE